MPGLYSESRYFDEFKARAKWAGFDLLWQEIVSLGGYSTVDRPRFLAILVRSEGPRLLEPRVAHPTCQKVGMDQDDTWCEALPQAYVQSHFLTPEVLSVYLSREMLPVEERRNSAMYLPSNIARFRTILPSDRLPASVLMASYGMQHCLDFNALSM